MKKLILLLAAGLLLANASGALANTLYLDTDSGTVNYLSTVNSTTGVASQVGAIKNSVGGGDLQITDIAYDFANQKMYATTNKQLYSLDYAHPSGGVVTATAIGTAGTATRKAWRPSAQPFIRGPPRQPRLQGLFMHISSTRSNIEP